MFIYTNKQLHVRAAFTGGHDHALQQAIDYNIESTPPASYTSKPGEDFFSRPHIMERVAIVAALAIR